MTSPELRASFDEETARFLHAVVRSAGADGTPAAALTAGHTVVDERLAAHFGVAAPPPGSFARRETLEPRAGLLTQGGTSSVARGPSSAATPPRAAIGCCAPSPAPTLSA